MKTENSDNLRELQILEQNLQSFLMQKQSFEIENTEIDNALSELTKTTGEVYRVLNNIMILSNKEELKKELEEKKKIISLRISSIEKQERLLEAKSEELRKEIQSSMNKDNKK